MKIGDLCVASENMMQQYNLQYKLYKIIDINEIFFTIQSVIDSKIMISFLGHPEDYSDILLPNEEVKEIEDKTIFSKIMDIVDEFQSMTKDKNELKLFKYHAQELIKILIKHYK